MQITAIDGHPNSARKSRRVNCIHCGTGTCHYFGYLFWSASRFWVPFRAIPIFLGIILLVQFDFFRNNPDFWILTLIFYFKGYCGMLPAGLLLLIFFSQI